MRKLLIISILIGFSTFAFSQKESKDVKNGNKFYKKNLYEQAQAEYENGLKKNPNSFSAAYNLGNSLFRQEKYNEAFEQYAKALPQCKDKESLANAFHNIGNAFLVQQQYEQSINAYKTALKIKPNAEDTRYNLAVAQYLMKQQQDKNNNQNQQQEQKQEQQQEQQQPQMSKEQAEKILQALQQDEKATQDKRKMKIQSKGKTEKQW